MDGSFQSDQAPVLWHHIDMNLLSLLSCALLIGIPGTDVSCTKPATDAAEPVVYDSVAFRNIAYDVVVVDLSRADVKLFWKNDDAMAIRSLRGLESHLKKQGDTLLFATNAGIYSKNFTPAGLHVENGEELRKLNLREGGGNFHLMPNGVFYIDDTGAHVEESEHYRDAKRAPRVATQSGPILVSHGALHPKFQEASTSVYVRSGVGVRPNGEVVFALSKSPVNFHTFATFFRDRLQCRDALYLDGQISRFYMPGVLEDSGPALYVGILAVVAREDTSPDAP